MAIKEAFGAALKARRLEQGLTQEDFSDVSSRTYLSTLERGRKCPTLEKVSDLACVLQVHPLTSCPGTDICYQRPSPEKRAG